MKMMRILFVLCSLLIVGFGPVTPAFAAKAAAQETQTATSRIDINTADAATLATLPGVGEKTAAAIIDYRQTNGSFKSVDELTQVKGIGEKKIAQLRPYVQTL